MAQTALQRQDDRTKALVEVVSELAFPLSRSLAWSLGSFWFERAELPRLFFSPAV